MPGGNKKKKKPAVNPARGFATTSTVSKTRIETTDQSKHSEQPPSKDATTQKPDKQPSSLAQPKEKDLNELTPEELEVQLETADIQRFVDQYAARTRKEAFRLSSKLQTEKRLLRTQAEPFSVKEWLPDEIAVEVLSILTESKPDKVQSVDNTFAPTDDLLSKVWQLQTCLLDLGFSSSRIEEAIAVLVANPTSIDSTQSWGLLSALDWFALHCQQDELREYDAITTKVSDNIDEPADEEEDSPPAAQSETSATRPQVADSAANGEQETDDCNISDLESDLEPDELISAYVRTKTKLSSLEPDSSAPTQQKRKPQATASKSTSTPSQRKLQSQLDKITSDILFDQQEGDAQWATKHIQLLRDESDRKKLQLDKQPTELDDTDVNDEAARIGEELLAEAGEEGDMLGGMFDALPGVAEPDPTAVDPETGPVTIRDFGKVTGMNPKRILEEICRARDSRCKLTYKMISATTYSSRHSVTINWSKEVEPIQYNELTGLAVHRRSKSLKVSMQAIATPDTAQSEAYIATAALFILASDSPKEAKASLRLPPAFRDVWDAFVVEKQENTDAKDRATVKQLRSLVEVNMPKDDEDEEEIVYNPAARRLNGNTSGTSTPPSEKHAQTGPVQALQDMWQQKTAAPAYQHMLQIRANLPMFAFRDQALQIISQHQVTILCGETGCGKSTQLPAFIVEQQLSEGKDCRVYCTEPRRISAISLAQRVSEEMGERKGDVGSNRSLVGYAIRLESHIAASTKLIYATVGIVLRMLENADGIENITHLILDEVHERSIDTDFLLIILRSLLLKRPDLKVVLMSATVDAQRFANYFDGAPIINVPGRTFPVEARFLEDAIEVTGHTQGDSGASIDADDYDIPEGETKMGDLTNYSKRTRTTLATFDEYRIDYELILKLLDHIATDPGHTAYSQAILVFLPGIAEIRQLNDILGGHGTFMRGWRVHPLHSTFSSEDQQSAFIVPPPGMRKIVLATNIAETGITIPDVTCVIDTGKHKEMRFDERRQMSRLIQSFIARANAKQRRGRAGRVQKGVCYHLFTRYRHDNLMIDQQTQELLRLSLQDLFMRVKICKLGDIAQTLAEALDPPSSKNVRRAIDALVEVDALTAGEELTSLGRQLAKLPLDAQLGKLLLLGNIYNCLDFALTIAATLSSKTPFLSPMHAKKQADSVRLGFKRGDSDLLTVFNAYTAWRKICQTSGVSEAHFCNKNFLSSQNLASIEDLKGQLLHSLADAGLVTLGQEDKAALSKLRYNQRHRNFVSLPSKHCQSDDNNDIINSVVAWSFYPKLLRRDGKGWRTLSNQSLGLHPTSVNKFTLSPDVKNLSFYSIMQTSSRFTNAQETSPVSDFALVLLAGEAAFNMFAGVIIIDGNRMKFRVRDWKTMLVLKRLRSRLKECQSRLLKNPGKDLPPSLQPWMRFFDKIFERGQAAA